MRKRVAVLGSCVTRDVFNSKFNENYKDAFECVLTQNQSSIICIMSEKIDYNPDKIDNLSEYATWNVRTDFTKEFLSLLKEKSPEYLLIDFFADIHFGCILVDENKYLTKNRWKIMKTRYYKELINRREISIDIDEKEYFEVWKNSVDRFFQFLSNELPQCNIIIHKARNVDSYITESNKVELIGERPTVAKINIELYNRIWGEMDNYVINNYEVKHISLFDNKRYLSYENHQWGPFYVHYTKDYYRDFLDRLTILTGK